MGDDWDDDDEWAEEAPAKSPAKASPTENSSDFVKLDEAQGKCLILIFIVHLVSYSLNFNVCHHVDARRSFNRSVII